MMFGFYPGGWITCISCMRQDTYLNISMRLTCRTAYSTGFTITTSILCGFFTRQHPLLSSSAYVYPYDEQLEQNLSFNIGTDASGQSCGPR